MTATSPQETSPASIPTTACAPLLSINLRNKHLALNNRSGFFCHPNDRDEKGTNSAGDKDATLISLQNQCAGGVIRALLDH
jgi:hypothetical protein